ncbi:MAG: glycerate-2-kinase family protein, partial [Synergistaceae bacterium]|nr:glycerate-2-kinase family protein [Synergistaceae bacterium]
MHERERLREDAEAIVREAIEAVLPEAAVREALRRGEIAERLGRGRVVLAAIGKAAWRMARAAVDQLGPGLGGALVTKHGHSMGDIEGVEVFEAGHPLPDEGSVRGAEAILRHVQGLGPDDTVLFLVSGGGSALFELPAPGVSLADMADVTSQLLACGAGIVEINTI